MYGNIVRYMYTKYIYIYKVTDVYLLRREEKQEGAPSCIGFTIEDVVLLLYIYKREDSVYLCTYNGMLT